MSQEDWAVALRGIVSRCRHLVMFLIGEVGFAISAAK